MRAGKAARCIAVFSRIDIAQFIALPSDLSGEITAAGVSFLAALLGVTVAQALLKEKRAE